MFGQRLKELRKKNSLTQSALGRQIGVSPSAIGMYEQGHREPDNHTLLKICDLFGVTTDYLINANLKHSIFFSPDVDQDLIEVIDSFTQCLLNQNNIFYHDYKLNGQEMEKISEAIKMAVNYYLTSEGFK